MICALTSDSADRSCNDATRARVVFADVPAAFVQLASVLNGRQCLDDPNSSTTNGTRIQMMNCNGTAAQQFRFSSDDVEFTSTGTGEVHIVGKCLDAPSGAQGTRIQINDCNGTTAQHVTVTSTGELQMPDMCLDIANGDASNGAAVVLEPCPVRAARSGRSAELELRRSQPVRCKLAPPRGRRRLSPEAPG